MPIIGEIKRGSEIGKCHPWNKYIWAACDNCGKERWVAFGHLKDGGKLRSLYCQDCARKANTKDKAGNWKGGRVIDNGYIAILLSRDDFFYPMANKSGYVREHRLVVAQALGHLLQPWEIIHHKGTKYPRGSIEDKQDNRYPENLELTTRGNHSLEHNKGYSDGYAKGLQDGRLKQIQELKQKIRELEEKANGSK